MTDWIDSIDLTITKPPKTLGAPKTLGSRKEPFKEIDLHRRYTYRTQELLPTPRELPKGSALESVIIENTELKAGEWKTARALSAKADRARQGAEYRANFIMGLIALAQET